MKHDIFISYRRKDAGAFAVMLYRDLTEAGYSVFLDHHTLGSGDFVENIYKVIDECGDFILLLSQDTLNERIHDKEDIIAMEIMRAYEKNKSIVGIMLDGFDVFPQSLPEELSFLPRINCLSGKIIYYEAMFQKLISGAFLVSRPQSTVVESDKSCKINTLEWFKNLSFQEKSAYMKLLLDLSHEFEVSSDRMHFYRYVDDFFRNFGIKETPPYKGDIPYDIVTYLAFFEPLYLILVSETLDISLVDEMFRYRFFAAVNNPTVQNSELLPQWQSYTNISALYDLWFEFIRDVCEKEGRSKGNDDIVYLYNYDLHKRQNAYIFVTSNFSPTEVRFLNKQLSKRVFTLRLLDERDIEEAMMLQSEVCKIILDDNVFVPLTDIEMENAITKQMSFGLYDSNNKLVAFSSLIITPDETSNLAVDCGYDDKNDSAVIDCMFTALDCRGFNTQRFLVQVSIFAATRYNKDMIFTTVSPDNFHSANNFVKSGFRLVNTKEKYGFTRDYYMLEVDDELKSLFYL